MTTRKTNDAEADGKAVWSWRPLLVSSWRRQGRLNRADRATQFANDGDKNEFVTGESSEETVKTIACGNAG